MSSVFTPIFEDFLIKCQDIYQAKISSLICENSKLREYIEHLELLLCKFGISYDTYPDLEASSDPKKPINGLVDSQPACFQNVNPQQEGSDQNCQAVKYLYSDSNSTSPIEEQRHTRNAQYEKTNQSLIDITSGPPISITKPFDVNDVLLLNDFDYFESEGPHINNGTLPEKSTSIYSQHSAQLLPINITENNLNNLPRSPISGNKPSYVCKPSKNDTFLETDNKLSVKTPKHDIEHSINSAVINLVNSNNVGEDENLHQVPFTSGLQTNKISQARPPQSIEGNCASTPTKHIDQDALGILNYKSPKHYHEMLTNQDDEEPLTQCTLPLMKLLKIEQCLTTFKYFLLLYAPQDKGPTIATVDESLFLEAIQQSNLSIDEVVGMTLDIKTCKRIYIDLDDFNLPSEPICIWEHYMIALPKLEGFNIINLSLNTHIPDFPENNHISQSYIRDTPLNLHNPIIPYKSLPILTATHKSSQDPNITVDNQNEIKNKLYKDYRLKYDGNFNDFYTSPIKKIYQSNYTDDLSHKFTPPRGVPTLEFDRSMYIPSTNSYTSSPYKSTRRGDLSPTQEGNTSFDEILAEIDNYYYPTIYDDHTSDLTQLIHTPVRTPQKKKDYMRITNKTELTHICTKEEEFRPQIKLPMNENHTENLSQTPSTNLRNRFLEKQSEDTNLDKPLGQIQVSEYTDSQTDKNNNKSIRNENETYVDMSHIEEDKKSKIEKTQILRHDSSSLEDTHVYPSTNEHQKHNHLKILTSNEKKLKKEEITQVLPCKKTHNKQFARASGKKTLQHKFDTKFPKFREVIRNRELRQQVPGYDCSQCVKFYKAIGEDTHAQGPHCGLINQTSRHRYYHTPFTTPPGFWEIGFPPSPK